MFKKIEIWILYLVVLLGIPITIGFGSVVRHEIIGGTKLGRISETALFFAEIPANIKKIFLNKNANEVLDRFPLLDSFNGTPNASESYLLLSRYDGDLKEGIVELVDLTNFKVLHTWNPDINAFNQLISKIPVIGNIVIPKEVGEGLFGISFKMKGPKGQIKTSINPIRTITPRFIQKIIDKNKKN